MLAVLLLLPTTSYRATDLLAAAAAQAIDVVVGSDQRQALEAFSAGATVTIPFARIDDAVRAIHQVHQERPLAAVIGLDDETTMIAAAASESLGLRHNPVSAVMRLSDKFAFRQLQRAAGLPHPDFRTIEAGREKTALPSGLAFPCVLKPTFLSASRGVIRADNAAEFAEARCRIAALLARPDIAERGGSAARRILVESFLVGPEVAFEGLLSGGRLRPLALFDKPDPLDGPYFEETIYVTPSRLPSEQTQLVMEAVGAAVSAAGLREGPVHAEVRLTATGPVVIEAAPRAIGGLCSRTIRLASGMALEEILLRHATGLAVQMPGPRHAAGVMMLPIPRTGLLRPVVGQAAARAVPGIDELVISIPAGQSVEALPEGNRYLGFLFARCTRPEDAEDALREAYGELEIVVEPI